MLAIIPQHVAYRVILTASCVLVCSALTFMGHVRLAHGEPPLLPESPLHPTKSDCRALSAEFYRIRRLEYQAYADCMRQRPQFGTRPGCNGPRLFAWAQCAHYEARLCHIRDTQESEVDACRRRLPATDSRRSALDNAELATGAMATWERTRSLLQSPESYLQKALNPFPNIVSQVYGPVYGEFDKEAGQQIYRFMHNRALTEVTRVPSPPIVRAFQSTALNHIARYHRRTLDELSTLERQIDQFQITPWDGIRTDTSKRFNELRRQNRRGD